MKKGILITLIFILMLTTIVNAKSVSYALRPNFGYRGLDGDVDQLVAGSSLDVIFTQVADGYLAFTPGVELSFGDDFTVFNVNLPIAFRYPMAGITPRAHMGLAVAYLKHNEHSDTDPEFLLGIGADFRISRKLYIGPQIETMSFDTVDAEVVATFYM